VQLLADEIVHRKVVLRLRELGFEIEWVRETGPGTLDPAILRRLDIADHVLITHDRDFGELVLRRGLAAPLAILYTRIEHRDWQTTSKRLAVILDAGPAPNAITTITRDKVRVRPYAAGVQNA
jgi:predicted nuclease of predicted toxin-antitoxin system